MTKLERYFIPFVLQTKAFQGHYFKHKEIVELRNISLIDIVHFIWYDYREYMFNNIKSLPHTGDLQTKAFQGHYLKHKDIVELRNISLIDIVHFIWYDYREYMFNNIKSLPHTGDLQTKAFQGHYLKHKEIVELRNISLIDIVHFVWYDYREYMFNNIKSLLHAGDLQTKAFQGHYLKHKEIVELRNISLIDIVHFVWYDYREYMFNNIKSLPHTGDLQTKAFQGHYLKHKEIVELRNISLIDTVHFVWYDYKEYMFNNIKSLPHAGDLQTKASQGHYLKQKEIVE